MGVGGEAEGGGSGYGGGNWREGAGGASKEETHAHNLAAHFVRGRNRVGAKPPEKWSSSAVEKNVIHVYRARVEYSK